MRCFLRRLGAGILVAAVLLVAAPIASAQTWIPTAAGSYAWNNGSNWTGGVFPNSPTAVANYNINILGNQATDLNQLIDLNTLNIGDLTASGTPAVFSTITIGPGAAGSFRFNGTAAIASQNGANTITAPVTLLGGMTLTNAGTAGNLTLAGPVDLGANTLSVGLTGSSTGADTRGVVVSGVISGPGGLTKSAGNFLVLTGANTYSGVTSIPSGAIRVAKSGTIGTGNLTLSGGQYFPEATFTRAIGTGAGQVQLTAGNTGFGTIGQDLAVNFGGANAPVVWGTGGFNPAQFTLSSTSSTGTVTVANPFDFNGATRTVRVEPGQAVVDAVLAGALGGTGGFIKTGDGLLELRAASTYDGPTTISFGQLRLTGAGTIGAGNLSIAGAGGTGAQFFPGATFNRALGTGAGQVQLPLGTIPAGFGTIGQDLTVNFGGAGATVVWGSTAFNPLRFLLSSTTSDATVTVVNPIDLNGAVREVTVQPGTAEVDAVLSGVISGAAGLTKSGDGLLALTAANTYTGVTTIGGNGTLRVSNATALGTTAGNTVVLGTARTNRLELAGGITSAEPIGLESRDASNAAVALSNLSGNNTLTGDVQLFGGGVRYNINSDAGLFTVAGNLFRVGTQTGIARAVVLSGAGNGLISGGIADNGTDIIPLVKTGTGTWTLTGVNTYDGATTVSAGTLKLAGNGSFATSPTVEVQAGATLDVTTGAGNLTGGTNFDSANSRFAVAAGQALRGSGTVLGGVTARSGSTVAAGPVAGGVGVLTVDASASGVLFEAGSNFGVRVVGGTASNGTNGSSTDDTTTPTTNALLRVAGGGQL